MNIHDNRGGLFIPLQFFTKAVGQAHRLQSDAKISARDMPFLQKRIRNFIYGRCRYGDGAKTRKARRRETHYLATCVDDCAAHCGWLKSHVEPNVWNKRCARPCVTIGSDKTDNSEGSHRPARSRAAYDEREAARFQSCHIAEVRYCTRGLKTFQYGDIRRRVASRHGC